MSGMDELLNPIVLPDPEDFEPVPFKGWRPYQDTHQDFEGAKKRIRETLLRNYNRGNGPQANPLKIPMEDVSAIMDYVQMLENLLQAAAMEKLECP